MPFHFDLNPTNLQDGYILQELIHNARIDQSTKNFSKTLKNQAQESESVKTDSNTIYFIIQ